MNMSYIEKIKSSATATAKVREHVREAVNRINQDFHTNGYGIFRHPGQYESNLAIAVGELKKALATMEQTRWPKDADYDEEERASSSEVDEEGSFEG